MFDFAPQHDEPQVVKDLREARSFIERGWTTHALARDIAGQSTRYPHSEGASQWCLLGALVAAIQPMVTGAWYPDQGRYSAAIKALSGLGAGDGDHDLVRFNNSRPNSAPVLELFDKAIARELAPVS